MTSSSALPDLRGNALDGIRGLLDSLGVVPAPTRDTAEDVITAELAARRLDARLVELRFGTLLLGASPQVARLLSFETARLHASLEDKIPGVVSDVRIRVERAH